jgi:hypothetical protein
MRDLEQASPRRRMLSAGTFLGGGFGVVCHLGDMLFMEGIWSASHERGKRSNIHSNMIAILGNKTRI